MAVSQPQYRSCGYSRGNPEEKEEIWELLTAWVHRNCLDAVMSQLGAEV
jgi:hypothetical protein